MLTLSILVLCPIGLQPLPNALGSFPAPFPTLSDRYLAQTTYPKPYEPSPVILTYADLPKPVSTPICYPDTSGLLCHAYSVYGKPHQAYLILSDASWPPKPCLAFPDLTQCLSSITAIPVPFRISYLSLSHTKCVWYCEHRDHVSCIPKTEELFPRTKLRKRKIADTIPCAGYYEFKKDLDANNMTVQQYYREMYNIHVK